MGGEKNIWIALLRGVNVGGRNKLPMKPLVKGLEGLGLDNVKTYIQSGNIIFCANDNDGRTLEETIANHILAENGFRPQIIVLSLRVFEQAANASPYPDAEPNQLHLFFLSEEPAAPDFKSMDTIRADSEQYVLDGRTLYLYTPDGFGRSKLAEKIEKLIGVKATARNWRSVTKIIELAKSA